MLIPWAVAAALLIAFVATFAAWRTNSQSLNAAIDQRATAIEENARLKESLGDAGAASTELAQINSVLSTPQFRFISLAGQEVAPNSSASIYWDTQGNRWVVTADLPPAPEGQVYQLWFVTPAAKISAGLINPNKKGHAFKVIEFPADITELAAAAITLEPEGGSEQPTMPIYALGKAS
jgi:anti-sigma-K factor RskA